MLYKPSNSFVHQTIQQLRNLHQPLKQISHTIFNFCYLCHQAINNKNSLCGTRTTNLPWIENSCYQCGIPLLANTPTLCGQCQISHLSYHQTLTLFRYEQPIDHMIHALKFHEQLYYARLFSQLMIEKILEMIACQHYHLPDVILAVPLHKQRLQERGFNQALEIAKPISRRLKIPLLTNAVIRHRYTTPQSAMLADERKKNLAQAFTVTSEIICGKTIAIVDDVMTTGATVQELAHTLQNAGAKKIDIWCCVRTC